MASTEPAARAAMTMASSAGSNSDGRSFALSAIRVSDSLLAPLAITGPAVGPLASTGMMRTTETLCPYAMSSAADAETSSVHTRRPSPPSHGPHGVIGDPTDSRPRDRCAPLVGVLPQLRGP